MKLLTKKQDKKMSDLQKSHQKSLSLIAATNERLIKRPGPTDNMYMQIFLVIFLFSYIFNSAMNLDHKRVAKKKP